MKHHKPETPSEARRKELRNLLETRRSEVVEQLQAAMRDVSVSREIETQGVRDDMERNEVDGRHEVNLALLEIRSETLKRIDEALARLAVNRYGRCVECGENIAVARLVALPFAARCTGCEEELEELARTRDGATRRYRIGAYGWADEDAFA